jgi:hypothetical protein
MTVYFLCHTRYMGIISVNIKNGRGRFARDKNLWRNLIFY